MRICYNVNGPILLYTNTLYPIFVPIHSIRKKVKSAFEAMAQSSVPPPPPTKVKEKSSKSPSPTKGLKTPSSNYKGVSYSKQDKKYLALIEYGGKLHSLGYYKLESDAALAYDKGSIVLLSDADSPNFSTRQAYEKAIQAEAEKTDPLLDVEESYKDVVKKVEVYLSNIYAGEKKTYDMEIEDDEGSEEDSDEDSSGEEVSESGKQNGSDIKEKNDPSNYIGVSKNRKKWKTQIRQAGKRPSFGNYALETDAALAYDEAVKLMRGFNVETNFADLEEYEKAKKDELEKTGLGNDASMSPAAIKAKVIEVVRKTFPVTSIHDGSSNKDPVKQPKAVAPKKKSSNYIGFSYLRHRNKWMSQITHDRGKVTLGYYNLQADAALAFDEAVKQLRGLDAKTNFSSLDDYEKAKKQELKETGLGSDAAKSSAVIKAKVIEIVRKNRPATSIHDSDSSKREFVDSKEENYKKKTSIYVGVSYHKTKKKWVSQIAHNGTIKLGYFKLQADAAFAFDEAVKQLRGSTAKTNFSSLEDYEKAKKQELIETGLGSDAAKSSASIISKISDIVSRNRPNTTITAQSSANQTSLAHQQDSSKHSNYIGVTYNNSTQSFESEIKHGRRKHHVGHWNLQSDAALAYDEACKLLNGEDCNNVNFASDQSYLDARSNEISKLFGSSVTIEPITSITSEIKRQLAKIPSPELDALNDAMTAKWSRYLPSVTGNDFMALYQQSMGKLLGMKTSHQSEEHDTSSSIVSGNVGIDNAKDTVVPEGVFKPISDSGQKDTSQPQPEVDESDDEASLFSGNGTEEEEETDAAVNTNDKVEAGAQSVLNDNTASSPVTEQNEPNMTEFPIGCPVMWNMNDNSFNCGTVSSKLTKGKQYEVVDREKSNSKLVPAESLSFGIDCPVNVAPSCEDKSPLLQGKVLMHTKKSYTILINKEGNQFQVMTGVTQDRVTFRRVEEVESSAAQPNKIAVAPELNDNVQKEKLPSPQQPHSDKPRWQPPSLHKKAIEDNDNSTITSLDSAQASSRRQLAGGSIPRKQSDNVDCRIYFPHWMIPDNVSRQRLFCEYPNRSVVYCSF